MRIGESNGLGVHAIASLRVVQQNGLPNEHSNGTDEMRISGRAGLIKELSQLRQSDPVKFESRMNEMATRLRDAAKNRSGDEAASMNAMATRISEASKSGDLSALRPATDALGYGPRVAAMRPSGGDSPFSVAASNRKQEPREPVEASAERGMQIPPGGLRGDPRDANRDGTVSDDESISYKLVKGTMLR